MSIRLIAVFLLVAVALRGSLVSVERGVSRVVLSINLTVTEHPHTQTALLGESAIFWCKGHGPSKLNIANTDAVPGLVDYFTFRGITWQHNSSDCSGISQWRVSILASNMNNGTMLKCFFHDNDCPGGVTHTAQLIAVTGELSQPTTADTNHYHHCYSRSTRSSCSSLSDSD